jgi:chemotaxis protein CheZ
LTRRIGSALTNVENNRSLESAGTNVASIIDAWPTDGGLYQQLRRLADFIEQTKIEIAALKPHDVKREHLPRATDELDAIVEATAGASHRIMDAADRIQEVMDDLGGEAAEKLLSAVTSIYEACTFQDITGQRITKVIKTLKTIEQRIDQMIGSDMHSAVLPSESQKIEDPDDLLAGPALPGQGASQAEIDALLAG